MSGLKIVFAGTPEFGLPCLDALFGSQHQIIAIYTQPDRPAGRGRQIHISAVKQWSLAHEISVFQPINFKDPNTVDELAALKPDVIVVIAYGLILPKTVLDIPRLACINVHASLLPRWRGASPIQHAILAGDTVSGVTIMKMDVGMDTGAMYCKASCSISEFDTAGSLHNKLAQLAPRPLIATLDDLVQIEPEMQDNSLATYAGKISKEDAHINFAKSAEEIDREIRAYNPWPIAFTVLEQETLRVHQARVTTIDCSETPGTILSLDKKGMLVATASKALQIERIQFSGGKIISIADWLNTGKTQLRKGSILQ